MGGPVNCSSICALREKKGREFQNDRRSKGCCLKNKKIKMTEEN
jgi:hypothetical protein